MVDSKTKPQSGSCGSQMGADRARKKESPGGGEYLSRRNGGFHGSRVGVKVHTGFAGKVEFQAETRREAPGVRSGVEKVEAIGDGMIWTTRRTE